MKTEFILLRHTKVVGPAALYGVTDVKSNEQDNLKLQQLLPQQFKLLDNIISSPLLRCASLAEKLSQQYTLPVIENNRFQEMNFGEYDGVPFDQLKEDWSSLESFWQQPKSFEFKSGENLSSFHHRVVSGWYKLLESYSGQTSLIVTHGGVIRMLLAEALKLDWSASSLYSNLTIGNASITKISFNDAECLFPNVEFIGLPLLER